MLASNEEPFSLATRRIALFRCLGFLRYRVQFGVYWVWGLRSDLQLGNLTALGQGRCGALPLARQRRWGGVHASLKSVCDRVLLWRRQVFNPPPCRHESTARCSLNLLAHMDWTFIAIGLEFNLFHDLVVE